jgi:hypothetical protein
MITRKLLILVGFIGLLVYVVWFPFFNVFRTGDINSTSFVDIFKYGVKHYSRDRNDAMNATEGRSLGLYFAVYNLIENDRYASMGKSTIAAIDHAIPKILNPSKGLGTEEELERRMKTYIDSADSVLLLAYAEFSFFGGVYAVLLFSLIYLFYNKVSNGIFKNNLINLFSIFILFDMSFNVERKLDAIFSEMISFLLFGIIVLIVYKMGLMLFIRR